VELPQAASEPLDEQEDEPLVVSIKADGTYYLNLGDDQKTARPLEEIKDIVGKIIRQKPKTAVLVWGDQSVDYGEVVSLMSELQGAGVPAVGLVTEPPG
jgi:biopolymer transport protein TolR